MGSRLPFNEATEDSLKSMVLDEECAGLWRTEDNEIVLLYSVDEKACTLALDIKIPLERLAFRLFTRRTVPASGSQTEKAVYLEERGKELPMKKSFNLFLCILCCLFSLSACSQPEKSVEEHVNMAQEQLGKPLGEAYQALGLPGNPEDAAEVFYLHAEDCVKVLGKQMDVAIVHLGKDEEDKKLTDEKTNSVEYLALLGGDYAYPLKLYRALREAYGEPEPVTGAQSFSQATEVSLEAMKQSERCANQWKKED